MMKNKKIRFLLSICIAIWVTMLISPIETQGQRSSDLMMASFSGENGGDSIVSLEDFLAELENSYKVNFFYQHHVVKNKFIDLKQDFLKDSEDKKRGELVAALLTQLGIRYERLDEQTYILFRNNTDQAPFVKLQEVRGTVTDASSGETLPGVNIVVKGTTIGTSTNPDGQYNMDVPSLQDTLVFSFIGYQTREVPINGRTEIDVTLVPKRLKGEEIIVTGVAGEMSTRKTPFSVSKISDEELNTVSATTDPISALQGKVSGAQIIRSEGTPGTGVSIQLRGINSINRGPDPLFIVDGVYLEAGRVDMEALDIQDIEIVKGASAASLYGSRAINGVIRITTKTGSGIDAGETRVSTRNEFGVNQMPIRFDVSRSHPKMLNSSGDWVRENSEGEIVSAEFHEASMDETINGMAFQDNPYPEFNNHMKRVFKPQFFNRNYASIAKRIEKTNFYLSFGNVNETGVIDLAEGYSRQSLRINLDHRISPKLQASVRSYFAIADLGNSFSIGNSPLASTIHINPAASLDAVDKDGVRLIQPDPTSLWENPLYLINNREADIKRNSQTINTRIHYTPLQWLDLEGQLSYNRENRVEENFWDIGFKKSRVGQQGKSGVELGRYEVANNSSDHWDASVSATIHHAFLNGQLETATTFKGILEQSIGEFNFAGGDDIAAAGVLGLANIEGSIFANSNFSDVRSAYGFITTQLDYKDTYIGSFLIRRDGSSKFGAEERWQTYYRLSGAYRISQEPWWPAKDFFNEFKLRYSFGTAGGQPGFDAQYETYKVSAGKISRDRLGNKELKPEFQAEHSFGLDFEIGNNISANFTYAKSIIENLLLEVPLTAAMGFRTQWKNAGDIKSDSYEAEIDASVIQNMNLQLNVGFVFSKHQSEVTRFGRTPFRAGPFSLIQYGDGIDLGSFYGARYLTSKEQLPDDMQQYSDQFQINDEGYLVAVGNGNSWKDGIEKELWGTGVDVNNDGSDEYKWGFPIASKRTNNKIGNSIPDFTAGFNTNLSWKNLGLYMLWDAQIGGDIYCHTCQLAIKNNVMGVTDQAGKPDYKKKPTKYYEEFKLVSNRYVFDGTYLKLRQLAVSYTLGSQQLQTLGLGILDEVRIGVKGNNLFVFTDYPGFDPEVGAGSRAAELRIDSFRYPNYRTITGSIEVQF